jgi:hypothetical protein
MKLPISVGERATNIFYRLPLGQKPKMPFAVTVYFVLQCIQLSEKVFKWQIREFSDLITPETAELASVLSERIFKNETPRQ